MAMLSALGSRLIDGEVATLIRKQTGDFRGRCQRFSLPATCIQRITRRGVSVSPT